MLYPLSYGSDYLIFDLTQGLAYSPALPQHNFGERCCVIRDTSPPFKHDRATV
jgi:hypothetical protein